MGATSGSFSPALSSDLTKEIGGWIVDIPAGAGVAQTVNPAVPFQSFTVNNLSLNWVRGTVTFTAGIISNAVAATRAFLISPNATVSFDLANSDGDNAAGSIDAIDSISFIAVQPGTASAEVSTLVAATAAVAGKMNIQFASS